MGQIYFLFFLCGVISTLGIGIFIWAFRRGKGDSPGTLESRVDRNNLDTGSGLDKLREINEETERLIDEAENTAGRGVETIDDTNRTVSEIIAAAARDKGEKPEG